MINSNTLRHLTDMNLSEIADIIDALYNDINDIQGLIEEEEYEEAKQVCLEVMELLEKEVL